MKLLIATGIYPPAIGGPATYSKLLVDELPKRGIDVGVLSFGEVLHLPKGISHVAYLLKMVARAREYDIVFAQDTVAIGLPALVAARLTKKRFLVRVPGDYAWEQAVQRFGVRDSIDEFQRKRYGFRVELFRFVQKYVVRKADLVFTPSVHFTSVVSGWCDGARTIHHVYNGIDLTPVEVDRSSARRLLHIPDDAIVVVSAGRLIRSKGFEAVIRICADLIREMPSLRLYVAGEGPDRTRLQALIKEMGLSGAAFLPGPVSREALFTYLRSADVFVLNSSFESFSFQVVEAMHAGVPVVTTTSGSLPELVEDGKDGLLAEPDDHEALTSAVRAIVTNRALRERLISHARLKAKTFSLAASLDRLVEVIQHSADSREH
jgi:glycosyltransferase involved in cell wall biosynthesis